MSYSQYFYFYALKHCINRKKKITVERPTVSQAEHQQSEKTITITLKTSKELYVNGTGIDLGQLYMKLKNLSKDYSIDQVLIDAERHLLMEI